MANPPSSRRESGLPKRNPTLAESRRSHRRGTSPRGLRPPPAMPSNRQDEPRGTPPPRNRQLGMQTQALYKRRNWPDAPPSDAADIAVELGVGGGGHAPRRMLHMVFTGAAVSSHRVAPVVLRDELLVASRNQSTRLACHGQNQPILADRRKVHTVFQRDSILFGSSGVHLMSWSIGTAM